MNSKYKMVFWLLLPITALANFYNVLGVESTADAVDLRNAFKKEALSFHPIYNPTKSQGSFEKFHRIALAFEILSKDRLRQVYDLYGEDAVRNEVNEFKFYTFESLWNRYFSRQEVMPEDLYANSEVVQLGFHNLNDLLNRDRFWIVIFYAHDDEKSRDISGEFKNLAQSLNNIIQVAGVDCKFDPIICKQYSINRFPSSVLFYEDLNSTPEIYKGAKQTQKMYDFIVPRLRSKIQKITKPNFEYFALSSAPKILYFNSKIFSDPIIKRLSIVFDEKVLFGEVHQSEQALVQNFGIQKFPAILGLTGEKTGHLYSESYEFSSLHTWIKKFKTIAPVVEFTVKQLTPELQAKGNCSNKDKGWCVMLFESKSNRSDILAKIQSHFENTSVSFFWVDTQEYPNFHAAFGHAELVIMRGSKKKYNVFKGQKTEQDLTSFIKLALAGGGDSKKLARIPSIKPRDDL